MKNSVTNVGCTCHKCSYNKYSLITIQNLADYELLGKLHQFNTSIVKQTNTNFCYKHIKLTVDLLTHIKSSHLPQNYEILYP